MKLEFGSIDQLPSVKNTSRKKVGSWRARYSAPNGKRISKTFPNKITAQAWLAAEKRLIDLEVWGTTTDSLTETAGRTAALSAHSRAVG